MTFHEIQVGQRFRMKPQYQKHPHLKTGVWERTEPTPPRETVSHDFKAKNAVYVEGEHTGLRVFFVDDIKGIEDKFELV